MPNELILHRLIVHELRKAPEEKDASLILSDNPLTVDDNAIELVAKLDEMFERKPDLLQGYLASPEESLFPGFYQVWLEEGQQRDGFIQFSQETMRALQLSLTGVVGAKGGYLLYADYTIDEQRLLGMFLIRDKAGLIFQTRDDQVGFELDTTTFLDIDHLAMACRVLNGPGRNVQLIRHARTQSKISQYFVDWVGLQRAESSTELTQTFLDAVDHLPLPKDPESGFAMEEADFKRSLIQFAAKSPQQTIQVDHFDEHFYGNEKPLRAYLQEENLPLDDGFRIDRRAMRRQFYLRASHQGISLSLNKDHLSSGLVDINEVDGKITINSLELAQFLLDQM
ncbi:MAG: nucleoid-associated protein [Bacteroidota bacterium]